MKFCPVCKTSYDEEILRFCTKDGTLLVEGKQPNFTALPSENDLGEDTVIRRKTPAPIPASAQALPDFDDEPERVSSPRIVIPMADEPFAEDAPPRREPVRTMTTESIRRQPPQKSNTAMVVALTVLGTIVLLGAGGIIFWMLSSRDNSNQNTNYNTNLNSVDINLNTNLAVGNTLANFNSNVNANSNANANSNLNANSNANLKSPTPTRSPTPTPETNANFNGNGNGAGNTNSNLPPPPSVSDTPNPRPTVTPSPRPSALPSNQSTPANRPVNAGILNSRAVNLPKPAYPPNAKQMHAEGQVAVQVSVDEAGNVTAAKATSGNPLLRSSAEAAARQSKFNPVRINNQAVPVNGVVLYNFTDQ